MKKTRFNNVHKNLGGKLVDFAGFEMPVLYTSIVDEHKAVREAVGVFDVSHMGEIFIRGEKALDYVQKITVNNAANLQNGDVQYSAMCYEDGGIVDDLLVYKISDEEFLLVVNGANLSKDYDWMLKNNDLGVSIDNESDDYSLLAVQGPKSQTVVQKICAKTIDLEFYHFMFANCAGVDMILSRTGYTGELGFELYFKGDETTAEKVWNALFEAGKDEGIIAAGLGCRDSLRLEMGYCLYGNDIDQTTNTIEANLGWITKLKKGEFIGREALQKVKDEGPKRKLVALQSDERAFPRQGYELAVNGSIVGEITSGTVSPIIEKPIALGYVDIEHAAIGNTINFVIRKKEIPATIIKLPFVKK